MCSVRNINITFQLYTNRACIKPGKSAVRYLHVFISTFPLSTIILLDFGAVPTMWYFCFSFHYFNSISFISFPLVSQGKCVESVHNC